MNLVIHNEQYFNFGEISSGKRTRRELIEKIKNLQSNIITELLNSPIDYDYIKECKLEIDLTLEEIKELS